jgi:glutamate N-acetyltransferase/amino-acid N-acetyltransferase
VHGEDPNWGRVLAAVGTTEATFDPDDLAVRMNGVEVAARCAAVVEPKPVDLTPTTVTVEIDLGAGSSEGWVWTNDLTAEYVHENSAYSS